MRPASATGSNVGSAPVLRLLRLMTPGWHRLALATAAATLAELAAVALMATAAWLISRAAQQPVLSALAIAIVAVRALAIGRGVFRYGDRLLGHNAVLSAVAGLRARMYEALVPLGGAPALRSGGLLTRLVDDVDAAQDLLLRCAIPAAVAAVVGASAAALSATVLPAAGVVLATGLLVAGLLVPLTTLLLSGRAGGKVAAARAELADEGVDLVWGAADLAAFGATDAALSRAGHTSTALARLERRKAFTTGAATATILLVQGLTTVAVTVIALRANASGALPEVLLAVLALTALTSFEVVTPLPAAARRFAEIRTSARRLAAILDAEPPVREPTSPAAAPEPPVTVQLHGLRARHRPRAKVFPSYDSEKTSRGAGPGTLDAEPGVLDAGPASPGAGPAALDGVDLRLKPGRRVALLGASGSGKSTLLAVLMRFLEYAEGSVTVGGTELRNLHGDDVRRLITGVTQDAHVFHAPLRDNLALAKPGAAQSELVDAARRTRLLDWIETLPDGWETVVGEGGGALSGGQRQRLILARALLADPPVLLLDEPTEGLDPETANEVLADLLAATDGHTTLLVTHQPAGLAAADEVAIMDAGRIVQHGTHDELLAEPGYYRDLLSARDLNHLSCPVSSR